MLRIGTPSFERGLLGDEVGGGVEHEAYADVEVARAVGVSRVVAAAVVRAEDRIEQRNSCLLSGAILAFRPLVVCALAGANVDGCARRDVNVPRVCNGE